MEAVGGRMAGTGIGERRWALLIGAVIGLLVGLIVGLLIGRDASPVEEARPSDVSQAVGPASVQNGVPVGYARTEEGAVVAATNFALVSTGDFLRDRPAFLKAAQTLAAPSWADGATRQAERGYEFALDRYGRDVDMTTAVIRYRLLSFSREEAVVRLWMVTVATGSKLPAGEAIWGNSTLHLAWIDEDWRVTDTESETGPAPAPLQPPAEADTIQSFMEEFIEFNEGPRP